MNSVEPLPAKQQPLSWLSDERRFWSVFALLLGAIAIAKGLRPAGTWALTQASIDYHLGFIKRGLHGELLHALHLHRAHSLRAVFFAEYAIFCALLLAVLHRSGLMARMGDARLLAMFAGSYALTVSIHLVGYADIVNGSLCMALWLIRKPAARMAAAIPIVTAALLMHENFLLMGLPVLLLTFAVDALVAANPRARRSVLAQGGALAVFTLAAALLITHFGLVTWQQSEQMRHDLLSSADFDVRYDFFITMWNPMASNMRDLGHFYLHEHWPWEEQLLGLLLFGPAAVMIVRVAWRALGTGLRAVKAHQRTTQQMKVLTVAVLAAPLLLNLLGWDIIRWDAFAVIDAMLVLATLSRALPPFALELSSAEKNAILILIALGMVSGYGLVDNEHVRLYPFYPSVRPSWAGRF